MSERASSSPSCPARYCFTVYQLSVLRVEQINIQFLKINTVSIKPSPLQMIFLIDSIHLCDHSSSETGLISLDHRAEDKL